MDKRNALDKKIDALDEIDRQDGDATLVCETLGIPLETLQDWLQDEAALRKQQSQRRRRQSERMTVNLQDEMLERSQAILKQMNDAALEKAPLNQLASALSSLIGTALKLEEVIEEIDESGEQVIRFEYYSDGQVQETPPWAESSEEVRRAIQSGRLRETLGQDRAGQDGHLGARAVVQPADLVAGADLPDGEPGLA